MSCTVHGVFLRLLAGGEVLIQPPNSAAAGIMPRAQNKIGSQRGAGGRNSRLPAHEEFHGGH